MCTTVVSSNGSLLYAINKELLIVYLFMKYFLTIIWLFPACIIKYLLYHTRDRSSPGHIHSETHGDRWRCSYRGPSHNQLPRSLSGYRRQCDWLLKNCVPTGDRLTVRDFSQSELMSLLFTFLNACLRLKEAIYKPAIPDVIVVDYLNWNYVGKEWRWWWSCKI